MKAVIIPAQVVVTAVPAATSVHNLHQEKNTAVNASLLYQLLFGKPTITAMPVETSVEAAPDHFSNYE